MQAVWHGWVTDLVHVLFRFFCGPHAKKSAALAKQQKKKPKGKGKGSTVEQSGNNASLCASINVKLYKNMYAHTYVICPDKDLYATCTHHITCTYSQKLLMLLRSVSLTFLGMQHVHTL